MPRPLVVIFTAVRMEHRAVARRLGARATSAAVSVATMGGRDTEIHTIGIGGRHLPAALPPNAACVILAGLGGGLDPALAVGDVVIDAGDFTLILGETDVEPPAAPDVRRGRIVSSSVPLTTPDDKARWFQESGALAVDMEASAVRPLAAAAGVPFVHVRAISDAAGDAVDPAVLGLVDAVGRPRPFGIAAYVLQHPGRVAALARLGAAANLAVGRLADAVAFIVAASALAPRGD